MTLFLCPSHGTSPVEFVCDHLGADFASGAAFRPGRQFTVLLRDFDPPDEVWFVRQICHECISDFGLPQDRETLYDDEVEASYQQLYTPHCLCRRCYRERLGSASASSGGSE